jgi:thymidylate kinase
MRTRGRLIVFEGPDEVGKTTLAEAAIAALREQGEKVLSAAFPGNIPGTLGEFIYRLHHAPSDFGVQQIGPESLQMLHIAAHLDAIDRIIMPALNAGTSVILDRFWWSTLIYGLVAGGDQRTLEQIIEVEKTRWGARRPEVVLLITRHQPLRAVKDINAWRQVTRRYAAVAAREVSHYPVITISNDTDLSRTVQRMQHALRTGESVEARSNTRASAKQRAIAGFHDLPLFNVRAALAPAKPTVVYDTYWRFAAERQAIFFRKLRTPVPPWTQDPILSQHKFTNAYRASDRVSQYLIREVAYAGDQAPEELFFRILVFKTFNRIGTWELLTRDLGPVRYADYQFSAYDRVLTDAMAAGQRIYSAAYIMTSGRSAFGSEKKHRNHLRLIEAMMRDEVPRRITDAKSMQEVFELLLTYPTLGPFLAYQYAIDLNYSRLTNFSEMEFVVPGPGARDGLRKCFADFGGLNEADLIRLVTERQHNEFERLGIAFPRLWGRSLQLIDCQNLFCEVDKYARVRHPEVNGVSGRTRIKQKYNPTSKPLAFWYPPKWGLNELIEKGLPDVPGL